MKPKVLITHPIAAQTLANLDDRIEFHCLSKESGKDLETAKIINKFDGLYTIQVEVDEQLLSTAPSLKCIVNFGVGYDNIDVDAATRHKVLVSNLPESTSKPTAELAMTLILAFYRKLVTNHNKLVNDTLDNWGAKSTLGNSISSKTLGIVGLGRIGKYLAQMATVFGMRIIYHNRNRLSRASEQKYHVQYASFEELLRTADVVSLHMPLNDSTKHLISISEFESMKSDALIINTARGKVIDEQALLQALKSGEIAGAGLDVFPDEPNINPELRKLTNVLLSPHNGTGTVEARQAMFLEGIHNIVGFFTEEKMTGIVNPTVMNR